MDLIKTDPDLSDDQKDEGSLRFTDQYIEELGADSLKDLMDDD